MWRLRIFVVLLSLILPYASSIAQTTWDTTYASANITFSPDKLTASVPNLGNPGVPSTTRSTTSYYAGKVYFEATVNSIDAGTGWRLGLGDGSTLTSVQISSGSDLDTLACGSGDPNYNFSGNASGICTHTSFSGGPVLQTAIDIVQDLIWSRLSTDAPGTWNGNPSADPATGVGGVSLRLGGGGQPLYIMWTGVGFLGTDSVTLNVGATPFTGTVPSGFSPWAAGGPTIPAAQTTWNPFDAAAIVALFDANSTAKIVSPTNSGNGAVRSTTSWRSGKVYFEVNVVQMSGGGAVGLSDNVYSLTDPLGATTHSFSCNFGGHAVYNSIPLGNCAPGALNAAILGVAVDIGAALWWSRRSTDAVGVWNGSALNNPSTGVGGIPLHVGTGTCPGLFITMEGGNHGNGNPNTDMAVINTDGTLPFQGNVPVGFTNWQGGGSGACPPLRTGQRSQVWIVQ